MQCRGCCYTLSLQYLGFRAHVSQTTSNGGTEIISDRAYGMLIAYSETARQLYPDAVSLRSSIASTGVSVIQKFSDRVANVSTALESFLALDTTKAELTEIFSQYAEDVHSKTIVRNDVYLSSWDNYIQKVGDLCDNIYNVSIQLTSRS